MSARSDRDPTERQRQYRHLQTVRLLQGSPPCGDPPVRHGHNPSIRGSGWQLGCSPTRRQHGLADGHLRPSRPSPHSRIGVPPSLRRPDGSKEGATWAGKTSPRRPERDRRRLRRGPVRHWDTRTSQIGAGPGHRTRPGSWSHRRSIGRADRSFASSWWSCNMDGTFDRSLVGGHRTGRVDDRVPRAQPRERLSSSPVPALPESRAQLGIIEQQRQSLRQAHDIIAREEEAAITDQLGASSRRRGNDRQSGGQAFEDGQRARLIPARRDHLNVTCIGARSGRTRGARGRAGAPRCLCRAARPRALRPNVGSGLARIRPQLVSPTNWMAKSLRSWAKTRHARRNVSGAFSTQIRPTNPKTGTPTRPRLPVRGARSKCGGIHPVDGDRAR